MGDCMRQVGGSGLDIRSLCLTLVLEMLQLVGLTCGLFVCRALESLEKTRG